MKNNGTMLTRTLARIRLLRQTRAWQDFAAAGRRAIKCHSDLADLRQSLHEQNASARRMIQQGEIRQLGAYRQTLERLDERRDLCLSRAAAAQTALNSGRRELLDARAQQKAVAMLEDRLARSRGVARDRREAQASQEQFLAHFLGLAAQEAARAPGPLLAGGGPGQIMGVQPMPQDEL
jgi:flagellar biosynthesis chaperone FliJ